MCVSKIVLEIVSEIHARVSELCSGNKNAGAGRTDGHPRRRQYTPPPLRRAGDKNEAKNVYIFLSIFILFFPYKK